MKTVYDLSRDELNELKDSYFYQLLDNDDEVLFPVKNGNKKDIENINCPEEIPDSVIFEHYDGISFVDDDFFCNCESEG